MSFERFSDFDTTSVTTAGSIEVMPDEDSSTEEIDLETTEGRLLLLQEIENLALTCDLADEPDLFEESDTFRLVGELQTALVAIEQTLSDGSDITDQQAQHVQQLYDELAIEVEQPAVVSVYVGPSRKDMVLEDVSDVDGEHITISHAAPRVVPTPAPTAASAATSPAREIHNRLTVHPQVTQRESVVDQDQALQQAIKKIEAKEMSFFDTWISDYQSPYEALGEMPFAELRALADSPIQSRNYAEFKALLEQEHIKYEVFLHWSQQFDRMEQLVQRTETKSFKQVIEEYVAAITAR